MDKNTLVTYGSIVVAVIIISCLMLAFTPIGQRIMVSIEDTVQGFMDGAEVEEIEATKPTVSREDMSDIEKTITLRVLFDNGQDVVPEQKIKVKYGEEFDVNDALPTPAEMSEISGYEPSYIPPAQKITRDMSITIIYYPKQYSIDYVLGGGVIVSSKPNTFLHNQTVSLPTKVVKEGSIFAGWYSDASATGQRLYSMNFKTLTPDANGCVTVYAKWTTAEYSVTYKSNNEDITNMLKEEYKNKLDELPLKVTYGYTQALPILATQGSSYFSGWYDNPKFEGAPITHTPEKPDEDLVYYARWSSEGFTISYETNRGKFSGTYLSSYIPGYIVTLPQNISRTGCSFVGWYDNPQCTGDEIKFISATDSGDKMFYAKWMPKTYSIDYDTDGGTIHGTYAQEYTYFNTAESIGGAPVILPVNVTKPGYTFKGWKDKNSTSDILLTQTKDGQAANLVLIAIYEPQGYEITLDANGGIMETLSGTTGTTKITAKYGQNYPTMYTPTKTGYTFNGWYTEKVGGTKITSSSIFSRTDAQTLYAQWKPNTHWIAYEQNGGTFATTPNTTHTYGTAFTLPTNITKSHYVFGGWYTDKNLTANSKIDTINAEHNSDITVYAKWNLIRYTITYENLAGGTMPNTYVTGYTYEDAIMLPTPVRFGYFFNGWDDTSTIAIEHYTSLDIHSYGDKTFSAIWSKQGFDVEVNLVDENGDVWTINNTKCTFIKSDVEIDTATKIDANEIAEQLGLQSYLYHDDVEFTITKNTEQQDGKYIIDIRAYQYRNIFVDAKYTVDNTILNIDNAYNSQYQYKQNEIIEIDDIINQDSGGYYVYAGFVYVNGEKINCNDSQELSEILENTLTEGDVTINISVMYNARQYNIIYENCNSNGFVTKYNPVDGLELQTPTKTCYIFKGWTMTNNGATVELTNNIIGKGTTGKITLTAKWERKDASDNCHNYVTDIAATCTEKGVEICSVCEVTRETNATGHHWNTNSNAMQINSETVGYVEIEDNGNVTLQEISVDNGAIYHSYKCDDCSVLLMKKHNLNNHTKIDNENHKQECEDCGFISISNHILNIIAEGDVTIDGATLHWTQTTQTKVNDSTMHEGTCSVCDSVVENKHTYIYEYVGVKEHKKTCTTCMNGNDLTNPSKEDHSWTKVVDGIRYCNYCNAQEQYSITLGDNSTDIALPESWQSTYYVPGTVVFDEPTRQCYTFNGWIITDENGNEIALNGNRLPENITGNLIADTNWIRLPANSEMHTYEITTAPTCTEKGIETCTSCGITREADAIGHNWDEAIPEEFYTSTDGYILTFDENGLLVLVPVVSNGGEDYHRRKCANCSEYLFSEHMYSEYIYTDTEHTTYCECGHSVVEEHDMQLTDIGNDTHHISVCTKCNATQEEMHNWTYNYIDEDCHEKICTICNSSTFGEHKVTEVVQVDNHFHKIVCEDCGERNVQHDIMSADMVDEDTHRGECGVCNAIVEQAHEFVYAPLDESDVRYETHHQKACPICLKTENDIIIEEHTFFELDGTKQCVCGIGTNEQCEVTGEAHNWEYKTLDDSIHEKTCADCAIVRKGYHNKVSIAPGDDYTHIVTCSECGDYSENHTVGELYSVYIATQFDENVHIGTCSVCNAQQVKGPHQIQCMNVDSGYDTPDNPLCRHMLICLPCMYQIEESHTLTCNATDKYRHQYECSLCDYTYTKELHENMVITSKDDYVHTISCDKCSETEFEHTISTEMIDSVTCHRWCTDGCGYDITYNINEKHISDIVDPINP